MQIVMKIWFENYILEHCRSVFRKLLAFFCPSMEINFHCAKYYKFQHQHHEAMKINYVNFNHQENSHQFLDLASFSDLNQ